MNAPHEDTPNEWASNLVDTHLYFLQQTSKEEISVLRTRLLWEEGLFCTACQCKELTDTPERMETLTCERCTPKKRGRKYKSK